jgi:hypothetical protein
LRIESAGTMPGKQAKILSPSDLHDLLIYASTTRQPRPKTFIEPPTKIELHPYLFSPKLIIENWQ